MSTFRLADVPMAKDRTAGFGYVRAAGDVVRAADDGTWLLTSEEAVRFAQHHPEIFSSAGAIADQTAGMLPMPPVAVDRPDHTKYRKVLDPMFSPRVVNAMEDELRGQVKDLIAAFADKGECDAVADLARLYPAQVFLTFFGMPLADRDQLLNWVETSSTTEMASALPRAPRSW